VQVKLGDEAVPLPRNPNVVVPPAGRDPLYDAFVTDTDEPVVPSVPFQTCEMLCPADAVHRTVQRLIAELPATTITSPWKPPDHELTVRYVDVHPPGADGELELADGLLDGLVGGLLDGAADDGAGAGPVGMSEHLALYLETPVLSFSEGQMNWLYLVSLSTKIFNQGIWVRSSTLLALVQKRWSAPASCTNALGVDAGSVGYRPSR
jgi:hypothetical protein